LLAVIILISLVMIMLNVYVVVERKLCLNSVEKVFLLA
jgi:hypothetical protein